MSNLERSLIACAVLCSALLGCVEQPGAQRIIGPDGTAMLHVHCADEQAVCFQIAGERCPNGYDLSPIFDPHDGNFLVRCRAPQGALELSSQAITVVRPAPTASSNPAPEEWPPVEVARPAEPWPSPSRGAGAPAPRNSNAGVGLGY